MRFSYWGSWCVSLPRSLVVGVLGVCFSALLHASCCVSFGFRGGVDLDLFRKVAHTQTKREHSSFPFPQGERCLVHSLPAS